MCDCSQLLFSFDTSILKVVVETKVIIIISSAGLFLQFHPNFKHNRFQQWKQCVKIYILRYNIICKRPTSFLQGLHSLSSHSKSGIALLVSVLKEPQVQRAP